MARTVGQVCLDLNEGQAARTVGVGNDSTVHRTAHGGQNMAARYCTRSPERRATQLR